MQHSKMPHPANRSSAGPASRTGSAQALPKFDPLALCVALGGLLQAAFRRTRAGASLPRRLYSSRCDFQPSARFLRRRQSNLPLARLRSQRRERLLTLHVDEFLHRFLLHVLPRGFVRIRHFGFLASRRREPLLPLCKQLLPVTSPAATPASTHSDTRSHSAPLWTCPLCGRLYTCGRASHCSSDRAPFSAGRLSYLRC
jgi:hypothetical protein